MAKTAVMAAFARVSVRALGTLPTSMYPQTVGRLPWRPGSFDSAMRIMSTYDATPACSSSAPEAKKSKQTLFTEHHEENVGVRHESARENRVERVLIDPRWPPSLWTSYLVPPHKALRPSSIKEEAPRGVTFERSVASRVRHPNNCTRLQVTLPAAVFGIPCVLPRRRAKMRQATPINADHS